LDEHDGLAIQNRTGQDGIELRIGDGVIRETGIDRPAAFFKNPLEPDDIVRVCGDVKTDGVDRGVLREERTSAAAVSGVAPLVHGAGIGMDGGFGRAAFAIEGSAQRQARRYGPFIGSARHRIEIGASHRAYGITEVMNSRAETLRTMLAQNPGDVFARYALAMEYANSGDLENAVKEYRAILAENESYAAAYYHGGQALEKLGRTDEARELYEKGIEATTRSGDLKTRNEIQAALDLLPI